MSVGVSAAKPVVRVVAGALFDDSGRVLIADRPPGKFMAGRWEFPGGKVAAGEGESAALARELQEELGIETLAARRGMALVHEYEDRTIELSMWIVERYRGSPRGLDGQRLKWVAVEELEHEDMLPADRPFIEALASATLTAGR
ncbi:MAG: 8-oxo-dGTP diphosphatase MutT [Steroidobacteraceae bacterium]